MENNKQEILTILMEECAEVTIEASKIIRFESDNDRIEKELGDLLCMVDILHRNEMIDIERVLEHIEAKRDKLQHWSNIDVK